MSFLFVTADSIGTPTGGGAVTFNESEALKEMGPCEVWDRQFLDSQWPEPWKWDEIAVCHAEGWATDFRLAHFYAGTFGKTVKALKDRGCKICYTIAAHDRAVSKREHEFYGIDFDKSYPHLCDGPLWDRYIEGYRLADCIVCPSSVAATTVRAYGPDFERKRIEIVPHGCVLPERGSPLPDQFTVGYLGAVGPDKGLRYLLEAWGKLGYQDGSRLLIAGRDSPALVNMVCQYCPEVAWTVSLLGWQDDVSDFYSKLSLYVQPSATEGFGIEVLEAMSHGRGVVCSDGAGAADVCPRKWVVPACDVESLAEAIDLTRDDVHDEDRLYYQEKAKDYNWPKVREQYKKIWESML